MDISCSLLVYLFKRKCSNDFFLNLVDFENNNHLRAITLNYVHGEIIYTVDLLNGLKRRI